MKNNMKRIRKNLSVRGALINLIIAFMLVSCGGAITSTSPPPEATLEPVATVEDVQDETTKSRRGGQVVIAIPGNIETIDPHLRSGLLLQLEIIANLYSQPITHEITLSEDGATCTVNNSEIGPLMAESVELSEDKSTLTMIMPEGLKFANGDPIDKAAWDYNFDRMFETQSVTTVLIGLGAVTERDQIEVADDQTIIMRTSKPNTQFPLLFASNSSGIINPKEANEHATEEDPWAKEWLRTNAAGSGPYKLESLGSDEIVLTRNENFVPVPLFDSDIPYIDRIIYRVVPDPTTRLALLQSGEIDMAYEVPEEGWAEIEANPNLTVYKHPSTEVVHIVMNNSMPPFDNPQVRKALSYAIPYDDIVDSVTLGTGQRLLNYVPNGMPGYVGDDFKYETNVEKAKELLDEAGFSEGFETEFFIEAGRADTEEIAVWIQSALKEIGVDIEITKLPTAAYFEQRRLRQLPFYLHTGWSTTTNDALNHLNWLVRSECCNYADYQNEKVWDIIDTYFLWPDEEERMEKIRETQEILMEDAPWILLYQPIRRLAVSSDIKGVCHDWLIGQNRFWLWYREDQ